MEKIVLCYDENKFRQCVNYFNRELPTAGILLIGKLIYLSERYHLRRYGRLISDAEYMLNMAGIVPEPITNYSHTNEPFDDIYLSESDINCLSAILISYRKYTLFDLMKYCEKLPEYNLARGRFNFGKTPIVDIRDFLLEPEEGVEELHPLDDEDREGLLELLEETSGINKILHGG